MNASPATAPPDLHFAATGERFEFRTSAKAGDGRFRFRWTLAPKKTGPPEHVHAGESETFAVASGLLRIWIDGAPRDLRAGESVVVAPGSRHRFLNPGPEPVVVDVELDGPLQEDALVPLALRLGGSTKMGLGDLATMIVHADAVRASEPPSAAGRAIMGGLAGLFRLFGARPLPRAGAW